MPISIQIHILKTIVYCRQLLSFQNTTNASKIKVNACTTKLYTKNNRKICIWMMYTHSIHFPKDQPRWGLNSTDKDKARHRAIQLEVLLHTNISLKRIPHSNVGQIDWLEGQKWNLFFSLYLSSKCNRSIKSDIKLFVAYDIGEYFNRFSFNYISILIPGLMKWTNLTEKNYSKMKLVWQSHHHGCCCFTLNGFPSTQCHK